MSDSVSSDQFVEENSGKQSKTVTVQISFCPKLGLYHCIRTNDHYFFDSVQLESGINEDLQAGNQKKAEYMAKLTSWARLFPHKIVTFFSDMTFEIRDPIVAKIDDEEGGSKEVDSVEGK